MFVCVKDEEQKKKKKKRKFLNFGKSIKIEIETTCIQREASERVKSYAAI